MKVFFGLLLIVNVTFAVFQWLLPYDQLFVEQRKIPAGEKLQLLTDASAEVVSEAEVVAEVTAETDAIAAAVEKIEKSLESARVDLVTEDTSDQRLCYTIGPIKDKARALEISGRYNANEVEVELKSSLEKEYQGVMVYIGGHKNRAAAVQTADALAAKGITDHIIVSNPENPNILSLGVFGLKRNADRLKARVEKMNFNVDTEARYRERTIYWLYAEQSNDITQRQLLEDTDFDIGISQIPTQCLPG